MKFQPVQAYRHGGKMVLQRFEGRPGAMLAGLFVAPLFTLERMFAEFCTGVICTLCIASKLPGVIWRAIW